MSWTIRPDVLARHGLVLEFVNAIIVELHADHWPAWVLDFIDETTARSEYDR